MTITHATPSVKMWDRQPLTYIPVRCKIDYRLNPFQRTVSLALIRVTASQLAVIFRREAPDYVNDDASHHRRLASEYLLLQTHGEGLMRKEIKK